MRKMAVVAAAALVLVGCAQPAGESAPEPRGMGSAAPYGDTGSEAETPEGAEPDSDDTEPEQPEPSDDPETEESEPAEEQTSADPSDEEVYGAPEQGAHDLLLKEVGQLAGLISQYTNEPIAQFKLTEIVVDFECTADDADPPSNGHYIGLQFEVETFPQLADEDESRLYMSSRDFVAWDEAGEQVSNLVPAGECLAGSDEINSPIGPSEVLVGWIVLDVPTTSGTVGYLPFGPGFGGWEWQYEE